MTRYVAILMIIIGFVVHEPIQAQSQTSPVYEHLICHPFLPDGRTIDSNQNFVLLLAGEMRSSIWILADASTNEAQVAKVQKPVAQASPAVRARLSVSARASRLELVYRSLTNDSHLKMSKLFLYTPDVRQMTIAEGRLTSQDISWLASSSIRAPIANRDNHSSRNALTIAAYTDFKPSDAELKNGVRVQCKASYYSQAAIKNPAKSSVSK